MIGNQYETHKKNVIDLFNFYEQKRKQFKKNDGVDIDALTSKVEDLKKGSFKLSVAGEVKAGKSTFINALLGTELLPSDVLQASSAIVEIFKSEKSFLKVTYADEITEETTDINEAKEKLHCICSISEEYRGMPTTIIDELIIKSIKSIKSGENNRLEVSKELIDEIKSIKSGENNRREVSKELIDKLEEESGEKLQGSEEKLYGYINSRTRSNIPTEIQFGYPLRWDFDELRIVDTPGVNAVGGVQHASFDYFEKADAILFVHPIKPIESESFKSFVDKVISNRSKDTLFLILTHAGIYDDKDISDLYTEAIRLYSDIIPEERILVVDSLLRLIYYDLDSEKNEDKVREEENKKILLARYREQAKDEGRNLIDVVKEASRFDNMYKAIDDFSMQAPNVQLKKILKKIKSGYRTQEEEFDSEALLLQSKLKNPQEFEAEINRLKNSLEEYKLLKNKVAEKIKQEYLSDSQNQIDALKAKYTELIVNSGTLEETRKNTTDGLNEISDYISLFSKDITEELNNQLEKLGKIFIEENHGVTLPKVDLEALEQRAKKGAFKEKDIYGDRDFDGLDLATLGIARIFRENRIKVGTKKGYNGKSHVDSLNRLCKEKFYEVVNDLHDKSNEILNFYLDYFNSEIDSEINSRQDALESEVSDKEENNKTKERIGIIDEKKRALQPEIENIDEILGNI